MGLGQEAFERLYAEHAQPLYAFLSYRTGDRVLAEDLLADTFERALRARRRYDPRRGGEKTWLYAIALNCLRDHMRRRGSEATALARVAADTDSGSSGGIEQIGDRDLIGRCLELLSEEEREAIALRFGADLTVPQIAKLTGERLTTVEGRVYRALRKLRDSIERPDTRLRLGRHDGQVVAGERGRANRERLLGPSPRA
jgi:RNA polymerase sigma-70 factor, ECF subfamily